MVDLMNPSTMKLQGKIQEEKVIILIDCGAIHNFISEKLAITFEFAHGGNFKLWINYGF